MGKFVFWVGVFALIWLAVRLVKILQRKHEASAKDDEAGPSGAGDSHARPVPVMQCAHCGVYVPDDEAVRDRNRVYCSIEHRVAGPSTRRNDPSA
jgi:uncharacterized protein